MLCSIAWVSMAAKRSASLTAELTECLTRAHSSAFLAAFQRSRVPTR